MVGQVGHLPHESTRGYTHITDARAAAHMQPRNQASSTRMLRTCNNYAWEFFRAACAGDPRRACAARVTVLGSVMCVSVCPSTSHF